MMKSRLIEVGAVVLAILMGIGLERALFAQGPLDDPDDLMRTKVTRIAAERPLDFIGELSDGAQKLTAAQYKTQMTSLLSTLRATKGDMVERWEAVYNLGPAAQTAMTAAAKVILADVKAEKDAEAAKAGQDVEAMP